MTGSGALDFRVSRHKHRGRKAGVQVSRGYGSVGSRTGVRAYASRKDFGARITVGKCREIAGYRSNTQCPPPVNMMTRFITKNMRS
jgi:hypothetical protein